MLFTVWLSDLLTIMLAFDDNMPLSQTNQSFASHQLNSSRRPKLPVKFAVVLHAISLHVAITYSGWTQSRGKRHARVVNKDPSPMEVFFAID